MEPSPESVRVSGKISREELKDAEAIVRSKFYWPRIVFTNWYGFALVLLLLWATILQIVRMDTTHVLGLSLMWVVVAAIFGWTVYRTRRKSERDYLSVEKSLPDFVTIARDGLHFDGPDGASAFSPWSHYKRWREGRQVIVLDRASGGGVTILAVSRLAATEGEAVRRLLRRYLAAGND
jgi:hypothetical protein